MLTLSIAGSVLLAKPLSAFSLHHSTQPEFGIMSVLKSGAL